MKNPSADNSRNLDLDALERAVEDHPLTQELIQQTIVETPFVILFNHEQVDKSNLEQKTKRILLSQLGKPESQIRVLNYVTAKEKQESFSGHGLMFSFFFHPKRDEIIYASKSTWRS